MTKPNPLTEQQLILLVQTTADSDAFSALVNMHQQALLAFLRRFTHNQSSAEDLTQDTFIKAFQKIATFKHQSSFKTWLFSIGHREFLQHTRKASVFDKVLKAFNIGREEPVQTDPLLNVALEKGLLQLPENERTALLLCDALGMSHTEAATTMSAPLGSVKTYVKRARTLMNEKLGDDDD